MYLAFIGWQELILVLAILIFLFGATRMKDIAKGLGESVREFRKGMKATPDQKEDDTIIEAAQKMGIDTKGKDIKQILREMEEKSSVKAV